MRPLFQIYMGTTIGASVMTGTVFSLKAIDQQSTTKRKFVYGVSSGLYGSLTGAGFGLCLPLVVGGWTAIQLIDKFSGLKKDSR